MEVVVEFRCRERFNLLDDVSREFRYCLETGADLTPATELSTLRLSVPVAGGSARLSPGRRRAPPRWNGAVEQLVERNRVSKPLEVYSRNIQNVAALKRAREQDFAVHPGQDIEYVVVDDKKTSRERVALAHEEIESYDETQLVRAVENVLSPIGWDRTKIRRELAETRVQELTAFANTKNS